MKIKLRSSESGGRTINGLNPGYFSPTRRGYRFVFLLFDYFFFGVFTCLFALALSPYIFRFILFVHFFILLLWSILFLLNYFVFLCLSFFPVSVYRGSWRMYVVPVKAQHKGMALYC